MKEHRKECGSYTVEAAFVVPLILGVAFVVLYILFLLHDKVVLQSNIDNVIFLLAEEKADKEEYGECLSEGLWFTQLEQVKIKNGRLIVSAKARITANLAIPVLTYFMNGKQEISVSESYCRVQPEVVIRYGKQAVRRTDG